MKEHLRAHINIVFSDAPDSERANELKEEMYQNLCDRYDDLLREGKSENAAYGIAIAGLGDLSDLIADLRREAGMAEMASNVETPGNYRVYTPEETEKIEKYRQTAGIMNSIAVALYILCWMPLVVLSSIAPGSSLPEIFGLGVMMVMIAVATVLMIMKGAIKPSFMRGGDDDDDDGENGDGRVNGEPKRRKNPILRAVVGILWGATVPLYLAISFITGAWHITWMIFLISVAVENITEAIFELVGKKYVE
ncbi:MAG: hypothetical protein IJY04_07770 [Clostridia bacterium]|nr:hypothetical protein [Clostridia bacterium]